MNDNKLKAVADFSPEAIQKAVAAETVQKPYSVYPVVLGTLGVVGGVLFGSYIAGVAGVTLATLGVGSGVWNYFFRHDILAGGYLAQMRRLMQDQSQQRLTSLEHDLRAFGCDEGVEQMAALTRKYDSLRSVLDRQLSPTERMYHQYLGTAEQVQLAVLDNLGAAVVLLDSVSEIDADSTHNGERKAVLADVQKMLAQNRTAIDQLDATAVQIARIKTKPGYASMELEEARALLAQAAANVHHYDMRKYER